MEDEIQYQLAITEYMDLLKQWSDKHIIRKCGELRSMGLLVIFQCVMNIQPYLEHLQFKRDRDYFKEQLLEKINKEFDKDRTKNDNT